MMPVSPVETFETDITEEIKQKQGFVTDVLAAHSSLPEQTPGQTIIRTLSFAIVFLLVTLVAGGWYFFNRNSKIESKPVVQSQPVVARREISIQSILPKTAGDIDRYVTKITKSEAGYIITLNNYTSVYGTIIHDEGSFGKELIKLFEIKTNASPVFKDLTISNQDMRIASLVLISTSTVSRAMLPPTLPVVSTTTKASTTPAKTSAASSTKKSTSSVPANVATTTVSETPAAIVEPIIDTGEALEYVSYGFVGTSTLLISTSQAKFLELRNSIIR